MLARLIRFCLIGFLLTGCTSVTNFHHAMVSSPAPSAAVSAPTAPHQIALLLPQQGDLANPAKVIQAGFNNAYQQNANKPVVRVYDTSQGQSIDALYDQAVSDGADFIIGPLDKNNVMSLQSHTIKVFTVALNTTPAVSTSPNLYEFGLSPTDEAMQVADKASQDGHRAALLIAPQGSWGDNIANTLQQRWLADGGTIVDKISVGNNSNMLNTQIRQLLQAQGDTRRQDFDVVFLMTQPVIARQIKPMLKLYNAGDVPVYSTSLVYTGLENSVADKDLDGIHFCDMPLVLDQNDQWSQVRQQFTMSQPGTSQQYLRLYGFGWDAALLTEQFNQLHSGGVNGATGKLYLDNRQEILRRLNWAVFSNGVPVLTS